MSNKDYVRLLVGDTSPYDQQLSDEAITAMLSDESNPVRAAVLAAETIGALYARRVAEGNRSGNDALLAHYQQLALRLRRKMARSGISPFAGGQSQSAKDAQAQNQDRVQPAFTRNMASEPGTDPMQPTQTLNPLTY